MKLFRLNLGGDIEERIVWLSNGKVHYSQGLLNTPLIEEHSNLEMEDFIKNCKEVGWVENESGVEELVAPKPMLAKIYEKESHKLSWPVIVQPKLDGFRCLAERKGRGNVICWSRSGKIFETTHEIEKELDKFLSLGMILDGELYNPQMSFNNLSGSIRNIRENASSALYYVYDIITLQPQLLRLTDVSKLILEAQSPLVRLVTSYICHTEEEVYEKANEFISQGYEGAIVRHCYALYRQDYRSSDLLKVKRWQDAEFEVIDFKSGEGKEEDCVLWICQTKEKKVFKVRPKGKYSQRKSLFLNAKLYINKMLTVRYFELSKDGIPRFPVGLGFKKENL